MLLQSNDPPIENQFVLLQRIKKMKNAKPIYRHTCTLCGCFSESHSSGESNRQICPECGAVGQDGFIATEELTLINAALHNLYNMKSMKRK